MITYLESEALSFHELFDFCSIVYFVVPELDPVHLLIPILFLTIRKFQCIILKQDCLDAEYFYDN